MTAVPVPRFVAARRALRRLRPQPSHVVMATPPGAPLSAGELVRLRIALAVCAAMVALIIALVAMRLPAPDLRYVPGAAAMLPRRGAALRLDAAPFFCVRRHSV